VSSYEGANAEDDNKPETTFQVFESSHSFSLTIKMPMTLLTTKLTLMPVDFKAIVGFGAVAIERAVMGITSTPIAGILGIYGNTLAYHTDTSMGIVAEGSNKCRH
jgi:hypothetical protein